FVEHIERLSPCGLLPIVDLAEIENGALRCLAAGQPPVLDNAEVSVILAVFASICAAQKHLSAAAWQRSISQKRGKVFTWPVSAIATLKAKGILLLEDRKCDLSAKVRLTRVRSPGVNLPDPLGFESTVTIRQIERFEHSRDQQRQRPPV